MPPSAKLLALELALARVVSPASLPPNVISMHSVFEFRDGITDQVRRGMLVYPGEEDDGLGRISILSPLGAALIGLSEGQSFQWRSATGLQWTLQVIRVVCQPESTNVGNDYRESEATALSRAELMRMTR
ncbi:GreA/GreB family elongation factor [Microvirga sp. Mcv34]|uniref:GreA/GreB family elongation factor n=1 Tax=Microvirga sp. Mcv34 TaxID=2926016 RepID=UPI0021C6BDCF|nr:GreA/GreB family elongation factor [Microvirga sp. Mcv34]